MKITDEDIAFIKTAKEIRDRGHYTDGEKLKEIYTRVLSEEIESGKYTKNLSPKCGSCLNKMVDTLWKEAEQIITGEQQEKES